MRALCRLVALTCLLAWQAPEPYVARADAHTNAVSYAGASRALPGRVDSLFADTPGDVVLALIGRPGSTLQFLPHDTLAVVAAAGVRLITIPNYLTAPGLAASPDGKRLYVLTDSTLLTLTGITMEVAARQNLRLQAIGWPAALTVSPSGDLFLIGQPAGAMEAQAYAFRADARGMMRPLWKVALGLTHAGAWMGLAGSGQLAVYLPDQSDVKGDVALLTLNTGTLRRSYAVPTAPAAADAAADRLYLAGTNTVQALTLRSGVPVARVSGATPLAVSSALDRVAFVRAGSLVVARAENLATVITLPFPGGLAPTALTWQGSMLLVGTARGITTLQPLAATKG